MKQIIIKNCNECPYKQGDLCWANQELDFKLGDGSSIPKECPLEEHFPRYSIFIRPDQEKKSKTVKLKKK